MTIPREIYADLAVLLSYPETGHDSALERVLERLGAASGDEASGGAIRQVEAYAAAIRPLTQEQREELYTRTFDINPVASLEIGWHLYGEQYERGAFLVRMRAMLRANDIREGTELPDYLPSVLRLLARLDADERHALLRSAVIRACAIMCEKVQASSQPHAHILDAVHTLFLATVNSSRGVSHHD
jgi:nitrate reductase delta subunit